MMYDLPKSLRIGGVEREIRSDYRAVLDICCALSDSELNAIEKALAALDIFYPDFDAMDSSDWGEALEKCLQFIDHGTSHQKKSTKLVDWEQDFPYIIGSINRTAGYEVRAVEYMHWWTFLSLYQEMSSDCTFAQILHIRDKLAHGKKLEKEEREWYNRNRSIIDLRSKYTAQDEAMLEAWAVK